MNVSQHWSGEETERGTDKEMQPHLRACLIGGDVGYDSESTDAAVIAVTPSRLCAVDEDVQRGQ